MFARASDDYPRISDATSWRAFSNMKTALAGVVSARNAAGDTRFYVHEFVRGTYPDDVTGCDFHANLGAHLKMADEAKAAIKLRTGWL